MVGRSRDTSGTAARPPWAPPRSAEVKVLVERAAAELTPQQHDVEDQPRRARPVRQR